MPRSQADWDPSDIREGDWFKTKNSTHTAQGRPRPQCFEYTVKPAVGWGAPAHLLKISPDALPVSTYIGPVHGPAEHFRGYVTVRVPSYHQPHRLCWVNLSKGDQKFAEKVPQEEVDRWVAAGWFNLIRLDLHR